MPARPSISARCVAALLAAVAGASQAVLRATRLPPAAALAPPAPTSYGRLGAAVESAANRLDGKTRMVARRIARFPRRSATTVLGIAMGLALLVTAQHFPLAISKIIEVTFGLAQRMDVMLSFPEPQDEAILRDIARLPGVLAVEPVRSTDVFFEAGSRRQRNSLIGVPPGAKLNRVLDEHLVAVQPRDDGLTLSQLIAGKLDVKVGDIVRVTATDGHRATAPTAGRRHREALHRRIGLHGTGRHEPHPAGAGPRHRRLRAHRSPAARSLQRGGQEAAARSCR